jgi:GNAT superfamily N-acetyltransferase
MQFIDLSFARRLEMTTAVSGRDCAEAVPVLPSGIHSASEEIAGGIAVFTGVDSPITQAFGVGLGGPVAQTELERLEDFFFSRGANTTLELCPFIDRALAEMLAKRPYRLEEFSNVLVREIEPGQADAPTAPGVTVRPAEPEEAQLYTRIVTAGFAEQVTVSESLLAILEGFFHRARGRCFFAYVDGEIAGGAAVAAHDGIGEFYGASTLPRFRGRGVQTALLRERMVWARKQGCELATTSTGPGTISQRNFERAGFRIVYSRTKMIREHL